MLASFGYDGFGRRRSKTTGGTTTQFLYDGLNPVQELSSGTPTADLLTGLGIDEFFTRTDAVGARHYLTDALGSTVALADGAGTVQTSYTYGPFGSTTTSGAGTANALAFTGREADGTGLYFYRARYHDPRLQRFVSEDPAEFAAGDTNLFAYVGNDPILLRDPAGLSTRSVCKKIAKWAKGRLRVLVLVCELIVEDEGPRPKVPPPMPKPPPKSGPKDPGKPGGTDPSTPGKLAPVPPPGGSDPPAPASPGGCSDRKPCSPTAGGDA